MVRISSVLFHYPDFLDLTCMHLGLRYEDKVLRSLKEVNSDCGVVGFYQSTSMGAFLSQKLVEIQASNFEKLRHGGIVVIHGGQPSMKIERFYATLSTSFLSSFCRYHPGLPRKRFAPGIPPNSRVFGSTQAKAIRYSKVRVALITSLLQHLTDFYIMFSLIDHRLTFSNILEELPVVIRNSVLLSAFLSKLTQPPTPPTLPTLGATAAPATSTSSTTILPSFSHLDLTSPAHLSRHMEVVIEALDAYKTEEGNLAYLSRQIARERAKADSFTAKRRDENASRVAQGLPPLPEEDVNRLFKIPPEPSRLESMVLMGQLDGYTKSLEASAGSGLVKMYAAQAGTST